MKNGAMFHGVSGWSLRYVVGIKNWTMGICNFWRKNRLTLKMRGFQTAVLTCKYTHVNKSQMVYCGAIQRILLKSLNQDIGMLWHSSQNVLMYFHYYYHSNWWRTTPQKRPNHNEMSIWTSLTTWYLPTDDNIIHKRLSVYVWFQLRCVV